MKYLLALLALCSCQHIPRVGYVEVSPYFGEGSIERIGSGPRAASESYGVMVTLGFKMENRHEQDAWEAMSKLDDRFDELHRITAAGVAASTDSGQPVVVHAGGTTTVEAGEDSGGLLGGLNVGEQPEDWTSGLGSLFWLFGVSLVILAIAKVRTAPGKDKS